MRETSLAVSPENWIRQMVSSKAARDRGLVRQKVQGIDRIIGCRRFEGELRRRGYRAVQNGSQYVIFCNNIALRLIE